MNNETYFHELDTRITQINILRKQCSTLAQGFIGENLLKEDFFFCASLDRCVQLSDGFIILLQQRNLTCVGAMLRLQLDNCMRTYAPFIAKNKDFVIDCIINGEKLANQKDMEGNKLTDFNLKNKMAKFSESFPKVYDQASGFIHLSHKAFYQTVSDISNGSISCQIGYPLQERYNPNLLEAADAFIHFTKLYYNFLFEIIDAKKHFDEIYEDKRYQK